MMVILEAVSGPILGRRIEVRSGTVMRFGRTGKSDYAIVEDGYLSGLHFSVECDGTQCRIRDLGSSNGTFVNGSRVTDQVVREGDSVVAGGSTFRIHMEVLPEITGVGMPRVATGPTAISVASQTMADISVRQAGYSPGEAALLSALYAPGEQVMAVIDASRDSRIPAFLDSSGETYSTISETVYIVVLPADARLVHVLIKDGWGRGWGFYCTSQAGLEKVREHFGGMVNVHTPAGPAITFRFWDPRVMRALIPVMPPKEADVFLGPCERIIVEVEKPDMAMELCRAPRGLRQQTFLLA